MGHAPTIVWLRQDLRLADHPALAAADGPVVVAFVLDEDGPWKPGGASRWWLHHSLAALGADLTSRGGRLVLLKGSAEREIPQLARQVNADAVHWLRRWEPEERAREARMAEALRGLGVAPRDFPADLLFEPGTVRTKGGAPFQVFTPFWRCAMTLGPRPLPLPAPERIESPDCAELPLDELGLMPARPWWQGMAENWQPGEAGARRRLAEFLQSGLDSYAVMRDRPDHVGTSMLSPHLAFGEISPRQVWHAAQRHPEAAGLETFLKELGWREFSHHLLATNPDLPSKPLNPAFAAFPWADDPLGLRAWQRGMTGFPIIDAGMRQLWQTGWMHNRVRMIVGSFLVKDLLLPWQVGEAWFWDTLLDANTAANAASWQWIAGCGADAAPYFRVFNPVLQGEKFDPRGRYVRQWVPELAAMPDLTIHRPWEAPPHVLAQAGIRLGVTYPHPILDHGAARRRALNAYGQVKGG